MQEARFADHASSSVAAVSARAAAFVVVVLIGGCEDPLIGRAPISHSPPVDLESALQNDGSTIDASPGSPAEIAAAFERDIEAFHRLREGHLEIRADARTTNLPAILDRPSAREVQFIDRTVQSTSSIDHHGEPAANSATHTDPAPPVLANLENEMQPSAEGPPEPVPMEMRLREAMVALRRELYRDASFADSPLRQYLVMAALTIIDPERALDPEALHDLDDRERELLRAWQDFFITAGAQLKETGDGESLVALVDDLQRALENRGPLTIARAELCTRVDGFGRFEPFEKNSFLAGNRQQVVIYTEIDEFTSVRNAEGRWVTDLRQELVIYGMHDRVPVWRLDWQSARDESATKLNDFFITHLISIPERLPVGQYTLKIRVKDQAAGSIAETGIPFQIVADEKLAARVQ